MSTVDNRTSNERVRDWRAGCECNRVGLCFRCQAAHEIERLELQVYALVNANKSLADAAAGQPSNRHAHEPVPVASNPLLANALESLAEEHSIELSDHSREILMDAAHALRTPLEPSADHWQAVQNAMAYLRTVELACDSRDDRQSVTYLGEIRSLIHRLHRSSQPPSAIPDVLFDGTAVWQEAKKIRNPIDPMIVSDVLDAVVRLLRASATKDATP